MSFVELALGFGKLKRDIWSTTQKRKFYKANANFRFYSRGYPISKKQELPRVAKSGLCFFSWNAEVRKCNVIHEFLIIQQAWKHRKYDLNNEFRLRLHWFRDCKYALLILFSSFFNSQKKQ